MKRGTSRHSKLLMLACELDIDTYAAVGLACCLWDWVGETMPQGNIGSAPDRIIAQVVGWRGDPSKLVCAMVRVGLLDEDPTHRLIVHDWSEHSDDGVHTYLWRRRIRFADGKAPRHRHLTSGERDACEAFYKLATNPPQTKCGENVATPQKSHVENADGTVRDGTVRNGSERSSNLFVSPQSGETETVAPQTVEPAKPDNAAKKPKLVPNYTPEFNTFWLAYPSVRRYKKQECWGIWSKDVEKHEKRDKAIEVIMQGLAKWCKSYQWTKKGGEFVNGSEVFLRRRMYLDEPTTAPVKEFE